MKTRLNLVEMQKFINGVVNKTSTYGMGYKQIFIDYYGAKLYDEIVFDSVTENENGEKIEDIEMIYDNEYEKLTSATYLNKIDMEQYKIILKAIDDELDRKTKFLMAGMVMSDANDAIARLVDKISDIVDNFGDMTGNINSNEVQNLISTFGALKDNINSDTLIKAMIDNGVIKGKKPTKKTTTKSKKPVNATEFVATQKTTENNK